MLCIMFVAQVSENKFSAVFTTAHNINYVMLKLNYHQLLASITLGCNRQLPIIKNDAKINNFST